MKTDHVYSGFEAQHVRYLRKLVIESGDGHVNLNDVIDAFPFVDDHYKLDEVANVHNTNIGGHDYTEGEDESFYSELEKVSPMVRDILDAMLGKDSDDGRVLQIEVPLYRLCDLLRPIVNEYKTDLEGRDAFVGNQEILVGYLMYAMRYVDRGDKDEVDSLLRIETYDSDWDDDDMRVYAIPYVRLPKTFNFIEYMSNKFGVKHMCVTGKRYKDDDWF